VACSREDFISTYFYLSVKGHFEDLWFDKRMISNHDITPQFFHRGLCRYIECGGKSKFGNCREITFPRISWKLKESGAISEFEYNIKMDVWETECKCMTWIHVYQDREIEWRNTLRINNVSSWFFYIHFYPKIFLFHIYFFADEFLKHCSEHCNEKSTDITGNRSQDRPISSTAP
jgi:hypothetical protein